MLASTRVEEWWVVWREGSLSRRWGCSPVLLHARASPPVSPCAVPGVSGSREPPVSRRGMSRALELNWRLRTIILSGADTIVVTTSVIMRGSLRSRVSHQSVGLHRECYRHSCSRTISATTRSRSSQPGPLWSWSWRRGGTRTESNSGWWEESSASLRQTRRMGGGAGWWTSVCRGRKQPSSVFSIPSCSASQRSVSSSQTSSISSSVGKPSSITSCSTTLSCSS